MNFSRTQCGQTTFLYFLTGFAVFGVGGIEFFSQNHAELEMSLWTFLSYLTPYLTLIPIGIGILSGLLPRRANIYVNYLGMCLLLLVYIQSQLLNRSYGAFDGSPIDWDALAIWGGFEILVSAVVLGIAWKYRYRLHDSPKPFLTCTTLILVVSATFHGVSERSVFANKHMSMDSTSLYEFSTDKPNVVMILLDGFASSAMDKILLEPNSPWQERFKDFAYYPDAAAHYPVTYLSIPAIFSAELYVNQEPRDQFLERTITERGLPEFLEKNGFQSDVITMIRYCRLMKHANCFTRGDAALMDRKEYAHFLRNLSFVLFRHVNHFLKQLLFQNDEWVLVDNYLNKTLAFSRKWKGNRGHREAIKIVHDFEKYGRATNRGTGTFKLLHLEIPHSPMHRNADCHVADNFREDPKKQYFEQSKCSLSLALMVIDKLKDLEVYENSLIVVLSDHGIKYDFAGNRESAIVKMVDKSYGLVMIKDLAADQKFSINSKPISLVDIPVTISKRLGLLSDYEGVDIFSQQQPAKRHYLFYSWGHKYDKLNHHPPIKEYEISGPIKDNKSWRFVGKHTYGKVK